MRNWLYFVFGIVVAFGVVACRSTPLDDAQPPTDLSPTESAPIEGSPADAGVDAVYPPPERTITEESYPATDGASVHTTDLVPQTFEGVIAFHSARGGSLQIYVMRGNSQSVDLLSAGTHQAYEPDWSPDCTTIAFTLEAEDGDLEIHLMDANGSNIRPLLANQRTDTSEWKPIWSPDGSMVAYQTNADYRFNVCFASSDGRDLGCLDRGEADNAHPAWSPDGETLFFASNRDGDWEIFRTEWGSSAPPVQLTDNDGTDFSPRVSPDGNLVVFQANRSGTNSIYLMSVDGSDERQLTDSATNQADPSFLGNDRVLYASEEEGDWELFLMGLDGGNRTRLTAQEGADRGAVWCESR